MNTPNDGGPAFPQHGFSVNPAIAEAMKAGGGMSLRDVFAAAALQGMLANPAIGFSMSAEAMSLTALSQADAMLAARERKEDA